MKFLLLAVLLLAQLPPMPPDTAPVIRTKEQIQARKDKNHALLTEKKKQLEFKIKQVKDMLAPFQKANPDIPVLYIDNGDSIVVKICVQ